MCTFVSSVVTSDSCSAVTMLSCAVLKSFQIPLFDGLLSSQIDYLFLQKRICIWHRIIRASSGVTFNWCRVHRTGPGISEYQSYPLDG